MGQYIMNKETGKIELHFDKTEYMALPDEQKQKIKSNYLFSRYSKAWVSRAKFPNLYFAEEVAKGLGLENGGSTGERLTFEEQQERKAERAEARAERMENRAYVAEKHAERLQAPINKMQGDIAFFTQPNIDSSAGRAFTRQRNRMFDAYEKGFEEFKKSEYYRQRAEAARQTAEKPTSKAFCQRRIDEANKTIRVQKKNIEHYEEGIKRIESGATIKNWKGESLTTADYDSHIERAEEIIENALEKVIYYQTIIEDLGGNPFSKDNIKVGYLVRLEKERDPVMVTSCGSKNITYRILTGGAAGFELKESYTGIKEIVSDKVSDEIKHPFKVGDVYTVPVLNHDTWKYEDKAYTVTKVTPEKVTLKCGTERAITRKPRLGIGNACNDWFLGIADGLHGTICKKGA